MSEERLDELVASLAGTRPVLDDIARARIAASLHAGREDRDGARRPGPGLRWLLGGGIAAAVALAVAIGLRARPVGQGTAFATASEFPRLPEGVPLLATHDASARAELAQAAVTLYGPGWATYQGHRLTVESETFVVDRSTGDAPVEISVRAATIRVLRATFAVHGSGELRVTVLRGEIALRCPGEDEGRVVTVGHDGLCELPQVVPGPRSPSSSVPPSGPASSAASPTRSERSAATAAPDRAAPADPGSAGLAPSTVPRPALPALRPLTETGDMASRHATTAAPAEPSSPPAASPIDPAARYAEAERAMASDADAARRALRALVSDAPGAPETAPALLDLARLAAAGGDHPAALAALDELARHPGAAALAMPAAYLRCVVTPDDAARRACFTGFRIQFPGSPHDADALAWLAVAAARGDCHAAHALIAEYLERYSDGAAASAIRAWKARCETAAPSP